MNCEQVRAKIIEVSRLVKQALVERGLTPEERQPRYKTHGGVARPRRNAFWSEERGYKYIDDVDDHLRRLLACAELLDPKPGGAVFEIGPGTGYFLFLCRELYGCRVAGVDWIEEEAADARAALRMPFHELQKYAFGLFREHLGLAGVVRHQVVKAFQPVAFGGSYDAIVATRAMFNRGWQEDKYRFWLRDCYQHLHPQGRLMIALNKVHPEALAALPFLRPRQPLGGDDKLTILSREEIGRVVGEQAQEG